MARKRDGNNDDYELEQMSRAELARLQRQYRIMEGDREAYSEEVKILLQKQRKTIEILEKERTELLYNLNYSKCHANELKTERNTKKMKRLLELHGKLEADIGREKSQVREFNLQIGKLEKELSRAKQKAGPKVSNKEELDSQERAQQQLENRLDVATIKLNRLLASNQRLRERIDHFLKERSLFNQSFQELTAKIQGGKKVIMDLMEQSTLAYDQREEAQAKLETLKQKGKQDVLVHSLEMKELQRKLDHDSKLQEFLCVKGQKRITADLEAKQAFLRRKFIYIFTFSKSTTDRKEALEQKIKHYQSLLEQIREISEEMDVDRLAAQFVKQEEENFALFNYVNELNNELEALQEQLDEVNKNVKEQRALSQAKALEKQAAIETLQTALEEKRKEVKVAEGNLNLCQRANDDVLKGIETLYQLLKCEENPILQLLGRKPLMTSQNDRLKIVRFPLAADWYITGENRIVTSFNVALYLGVIEKRAAQLSAISCECAANSVL
ncbi:hypothetical protein RUM43_006688 [Polyplax serrata]|uniref:ODAD1 central coiled coil region domain-containing protein n=1 Tax=Polyplax serrata TaxID=468196 RepID=A0AAN8NY41_POLSC